MFRSFWLSRWFAALVAGLVCGISGWVIGGLGFGWDWRTPEPVKPKYLVAVTDFQPGDRIMSLETQLREQEFVPGTQPRGAFSKEDIVAKPDKLLGKVLVRPLAKAEAVTEQHVKDVDISPHLPESYRAIAIPVKLEA